MPKPNRGGPIRLNQVAEKRGYRAYDPAEDREQARKVLAYGLLALLAAIILALLGAEIAGLLNLDETKDLATAIMAPIVVLVGTVLGFYFGSQSY